MARKRKDIQHAEYLFWRIRQIAREAHKEVQRAEYRIIANLSNQGLRSLQSDKAE